MCFGNTRSVFFAKNTIWFGAALRISILLGILIENSKVRSIHLNCKNKIVMEEIMCIVIDLILAGLAIWFVVENFMYYLQ